MRTLADGIEPTDSAHPTSQPSKIASTSAALGASLPAEDLIPCDVSEWVDLNEGERIVVQRDREYPKVGEIDVISEDAFNFWVWLDNGEGRILVSAQESANVWRSRSKR